MFIQIYHIMLVCDIYEKISRMISKRHHLQLRDIFYSVGHAYTVQDFDYVMAEVNRIYYRVKNYLYEIDYNKWSRAHSISNKIMIYDFKHSKASWRDVYMIERWNYKNSKEILYTNTKFTVKYESILTDNLNVSQHMMVSFI